MLLYKLRLGHGNQSLVANHLEPPAWSLGLSLALTEQAVGAIVGEVTSHELLKRGITVPRMAINNQTACWSIDNADMTYVLMANIEIHSLVRQDDHAQQPPGGKGFSSGAHKHPVLRPASLRLPPAPGLIEYPTAKQEPNRKYTLTLQDLPPDLQVKVTSNTVIQATSQWATQQAITDFMVAALHSFGDDAHVTGKWSVYVGKHNDCTADDGHPDAFSRAFQMNGPAAEMSRTRSTIGYGPSKGPGRKAALLTIRNVAPGQSEYYNLGAHCKEGQDVLC